MPAWSAKAAATTLSRIARRLDDRSTASPTIKAIPATPIKNLVMPSSPLRSSPDHLSFPRAQRAVQHVDCRADIVGDEQLGAARRRHEAGRDDMVHHLDQIVPEAGDVEQGKRLGVVAQSVPGPRLEQLVERADAAGQR